MDIDRFWRYSAAELCAVIAARNDERTDSMKRMFAAAYHAASLTGIAVNAPKKFPKDVTAAFPELFGKGVGGVPVSDWERSKENMEEYAKVRRRRKK